MSAEIVALIGVIAAASITGVLAVLAKVATPRLQRNAIVVDSALGMVAQYRAEYDRHVATIDRLNQRITDLEAEIARHRKGET